MEEFFTLLEKWNIPFRKFDQKDVDYYKQWLPTVQTIIEIENSHDKLGCIGFAS